MKTTLYVLITMAILMFITPVISNPAKWSRFIKSKSQDEVTISFRQKQNNQGWSIEWQVKNNSDSSVEPILLSRQYFCKNGESVILNQQSLGVYLPGTQRKGGIKDLGICPNSKIKFVEIKSEIIRLPYVQQTTVTGL